MKKYVALTALCFAFTTQANDSMGFVSTGGVEYLKNDNIAMQKENLFISLDKIKVDYEYQNLTDKDITETVLFPLPEVFLYDYGDFADTAGLINTFKIYANGKEIKPQVHVRAFLYKTEKEGTEEQKFVPHDVTAIFRDCGLTEEELMEPWLRKSASAENKILKCKDPRLAKFELEKYEGELFWGGQIIYSWQQTFKASDTTYISHEYAPLVGGGVSISSILELGEEIPFTEQYCIGPEFKHAIKKLIPEGGGSYRQLGYILKTGANWAKPITDFTLTIERPKDQLVSFCWKGKGEVKKVLQNDKVVQFQVQEKDFLPQQDLDVLYAP